jgi:hypothetical protein
MGEVRTSVCQSGIHGRRWAFRILTLLVRMASARSVTGSRHAMSGDAQTITLPRT